MGKYFLLKTGLVISLLVLLAGVARLSVVRYSYYKNLAIDNKLLEINIPAPRGQILDRKERVIALSVYQYADGSLGDFKGYKFEGKDLAYEIKRKYPYNNALGLLSGYVNKANEEDMKKEKCRMSLDSNDLVGRAGVEDTFDCDLRGTDGKRMIEVDALGKYVRELGRAEPIVGKDIKLTIDAYWQEKAYKLIEDKRAVLIVSDPKTGEIIVLASSPSFNPNDFSFDKNDSMIKSYLSDNENLPMMNRTISGRYHPGSVFKLVVATGGLESGVIDKNTSFEDTGVIKVGEYSYNNWLWTKNGKTDGMVNIYKGLQRSNDIFFYRLGESLGVDRIKQLSLKFGYGEKTGIELPGELEGIVPDDKWKRETKGERWFLGNTYHLSIGQGDLSVTPLQVNQMTNVVANDGKRCSMTIFADAKKN
jgi:penicillin-binding protein 2